MAVITEQEQQKVNAFKAEHKMKWNAEQAQKKSEAYHNGKEFTPTDYVEVSDEDALAAVRAGWKSGLEKRFEKKRIHDAARGKEWGKPFKI